MKEPNYSDFEYANTKKLTRREPVLAEIDAVTSWTATVSVLEPFFPKGRGRFPIDLERMLRTYVTLQR